MAEWYWKNNFLLTTLSIEACICLPFSFRKGALLKWTALSSVMLLLSTATMQNWVWEGNTILADNILNNVAWRCILCLLSAYQIYLCHEVDRSNALYLMVISVTCQRIQFNIYKVVEAILLGYIFLDGPAQSSIPICLFTLAAACLIVVLIFHKREILAFKRGIKNTAILLCAVGLQILTDTYNMFLFIYDPNVNIGVTMIEIRLYVILCDVLMIYMLYNLTVRRTLEMEKIATETITKQRTIQYESSRELMQMISLKSHDLKKQLRYLKQNPTGKEELVAELESLTSSFDSLIQTENEALSTILSEKAATCSHEQIPFTVVCNVSRLDFMQDLDIYTLFANLLDNAIEASLSLEPQQRGISVIIKCTQGFLSIHQDNRFSGKLNTNGDELLTTKRDSISHGYGFQSMRKIVEHYNGIISYQATDKTFTINILIPLEDNESTVAQPLSHTVSVS